MKARQAKKIMRFASGGRTHKVSRYWYWRLVDFQALTRVDHRIAEAWRITRKPARRWNALALSVADQIKLACEERLAELDHQNDDQPCEYVNKAIYDNIQTSGL